ncbi:MAG: helix-turn-helix domain-containing protein [Micromonosporaceae bacterium]|nr:helix-turn-helix domain-containing protein [Micromonosporaceae bacterium]
MPERDHDGLVKDLALRLAALDPDASAALRVIAHFDRLSSTRAGLPTIVREAAALAGHPARLVDEERRLVVRVEPDGRARPSTTAADPTWPFAPLPGAATARIWLERPGPVGPVDAMVLERAAATAAAVLHRIRDGFAPTRPSIDPACVDLIVDPTVPAPDRARAARQLGLAPTGLARVVAVLGTPPHVEPLPHVEALPHVEPLPPRRPAPYSASRAGIGPAVPILDLPSSWANAKAALRFTAEGTAMDPGPRHVVYEELGGLVLLATMAGPTTEPVPDVRALTSAAATAPWALLTLSAVAETSSLRAAATALRIHHSTLHDRLALVQRQLGWTVRDPSGRLRLQVALILRRLQHGPHIDNVDHRASFHR